MILHLFFIFESLIALQKDAHAALSANNHELKKRRIAVTLSDPRVRARYRFVEMIFGFLRC